MPRCPERIATPPTWEEIGERIRRHGRVPPLPFLPRVWELRGQLRAYDAAYVALAEQLEAVLVTTDGRLARSHGHRAHIAAFPG